PSGSEAPGAEGAHALGNDLSNHLNLFLARLDRLPHPAPAASVIGLISAAFRHEKDGRSLMACRSVAFISSTRIDDLRRPAHRERDDRPSPAGGRSAARPAGSGGGPGQEEMPVIGSMTRRTSVTLLAGKPLRRACSCTRASLSAR